MKQRLLILSVSLLMGSIAFACFWDYDTVEMERQQFPSVIELLSGNFLRHSEEFHFWRIRDRELQLKESPESLELLDDLAVSYSKTGNDKKAIEIGLAQLELSPSRYETLANLGTFYIHSGDLATGIRYIDSAIAVNPSAHFGREIYQRHLAEYVQSKSENGKIPLPLCSVFSKYPDAPPEPKELQNFYQFLVDKVNSKANTEDEVYKLEKEELEEAIIAVLGMMKFGNSDSPILAEVLGDLLINGGWYEGARQLAARAYLKASYICENEKAQEIYLKRVAFVLFHQFTHKNGTQFTIADLENLFNEEIAIGDVFFNKIKADEIGWITRGQNPEKEFGLKYYKEPILGERVQTGSIKRGDKSRMYLADTLIGNIVDYRAIHNLSHSPNKEAEELVDSLMANKTMNLVSEDAPIDKPERDGKWIWIIGLTAIAGIGYWKMKQKN